VRVVDQAQPGQRQLGRRRFCDSPVTVDRRLVALHDASFIS